MNFKPGDKLICINNVGYPALRLGGGYEFVSPKLDSLINVSYGGGLPFAAFPSRFKLDRPASLDDMVEL